MDDSSDFDDRSGINDRTSTDDSSGIDNSSVIATDWGSIIRDASAEFYKTAVGIKVTISANDLHFLDYDKLVKAVSAMTIKDNLLYCNRTCEGIVLDVLEDEKEFLKKYVNVGQFAQEKSAVLKILRGLIQASGFRSRNGKPLTIEDSSILKKTPGLLYGENKKLVAKVSGGGTLRAPGPWRKELTRRVRQHAAQKK